MNHRAFLTLFVVFCLCIGLFAGCHRQDPADGSSDPASVSTPDSSVNDPSDDSSDSSLPESSEPDVPDSIPDSADDSTPNSSSEPSSRPDREDSSFSDPSDQPDPYPESSAADGRDWTQPKVRTTTISASRLAELKKKWNKLSVPTWKEQFDDSLPSAQLTKETPVTAHIQVALQGGSVSLSAQQGITGWKLTAGGADTLLLDLDASAAKALAGRRVAVAIDYYAPRSTTALRLTEAAGSVAVKPSATKAWGRALKILESPAFAGGVSGHDLSLTVTGGSAIITGIRLFALDATAKEVGKVTVLMPKYGEDRDPLVVNTTVQQFGAVGDGKADDTAAFQAAVDYVGALGGGTVYVPAGHYALGGRLTVPANVLLTGELDTAAVKKSGKITGTVLDLYYGKNQPDAEAAITLCNGAAIQYMALWYPEQKITDGKAIPYAYTLGGAYSTGGVSYGVDIENIVLVNAYNGMRFGPKYNVLETIRNVWGTPLNNGFIMDANADLARVEGIYFSPSYWANSGLPYAPERDWIFSCTFAQAVAYIAERVDWTYIFDLHADGYQTGLLLRFSTGKVGKGASNGSLYRLDIADCFYGVDIAYMNEIGMEIAESKIYSSGLGDAAAIRVRSGLASTLSLTDCELGARGKHVIYSYKEDVLSLSGCTLSFLGDTAHGAAIYSYKGAVSATELTFRHVVTDAYLGKAVPSASFVNCGKPVLRDLTGGGNTRVVTDASVKLTKPPAYTLTQANNHKPSAQNLVDMTGSIASGDDIAGRLQTALSSLKGKGGIVYVPAGRYRLDAPITIPEGVELRGATDAPVYNTSVATVFVTAYGKGNEKAAPLITMQAKSGIVGITVNHEQNSQSPSAYPYVIRGNGSDIYVRNVSMNSCYNGIDFATNRCDRHLVQSFSGVVLNQGLVVGGGSKNGVIRDVLVNPVYWGGNGSYNDAMSYALKHADGIVIGDSTGELLYSTFYYAAERGLVFREGCKDAVSIAHGTDCADIGLYLEGKCGAIYLVNYQVASWTGADVSYIKTAESFTGTLNINGMLGWGGPNIGLHLLGGTVRIRQCKMVRYGSRALDLGKADVQLIGMHLYQTRSVSSPLTPNLVLNENAGSLILAGSVFDNEPNLQDFSGRDILKGPDALLF